MPLTRYNCNNGFHAPKNREAPVVVAGQEDGCLMIFDMNTGKLAHEVQAHRSPVLGMDNHPRNSMFVSCSMDKDNLARVWRYESHFSGREGDTDIRPAASSVAFAPTTLWFRPCARLRGARRHGRRVTKHARGGDG